MTAQIGTYTVVGAGTVLSYNNDPRPLSWTDGTPTVSASNATNGLYINGTGNGFSFTAPADTNMRKLTVHVGGWMSGGTLTAHLSDSSAADYTDVTTSANGQYDRNYTFTYNAVTSSQTLTVKWVMTSGAGNVTLNGAALSLAGPSVAPTAGSSQSTMVNTAFGTLLQAAVTDANNNPLGGVTVTFTVPATGPSAVFSGPMPVTAVTGTNGIATAPILTATSQAGGPYLVTASATGATSATFSLTNTPGPPASITTTAGTPQSEPVNRAFATPLQATALDSSNNPVSGVVVTFSPPSTGPSASFAGPSPTTVVTDKNGVATAPALTANNQAGGPYAITASVTGVSTPASFNLVNNPPPPMGTLSGSGTTASTTASLTTEGTADWEHWGDTSVTRKASVTAQISTYTAVGAGTVLTYNNDPRPLSWTDGAPTASATSNTNGLYINGTGNGFSFTAPADTNMRKLTVHVGGWMSGGTLTAHLSDSSAPDYMDVTTSASGQYDRNYALLYSALTSGQTLTVKWVMTSGGGNVTLNGAALSLAGPSVAATAGSPQSTAVNTAFATLLQVTVKDASNNPLSGVTVSFSVPATGASAVFSGPTPVAATTDSNGIATAPALTANSQPGSYMVTASATGATPASFSLTNTAGPPAAINATAGSPQITPTSKAFATPLQVTVTDAGNNPVSGVTVTFAVPATGPSAVFTGPVPATAVTGTNGVATAPALTANSQAGGPYTVTASVAGLTPTASFSLTNLAGSPASVTSSAGTPQSATVTSAFSTNLQAVVKDASNNLLSGIVVTFAAPAIGASGVFGGSATATATTNSSGVATAPALTANGQAGTYTVTAGVTGVTTKANYSLTNLAGPPASITATTGTPQSTTINSAFGTNLQAVVRDANSNLLSGVTVTFTAPTTGAAGFFGSSNTATAATNSSGVATVRSFTANSQSGSYTVFASVTGLTPQASFSLTNNVPSAVPIKLIQGNTLDSLINLQTATVSFKSNNTAGNWIGVVISGSPSSADTFTVTDSNGNQYHPALVFGGTSLNTTLAIYYAENIKGGANTVKVVPNSGVYLRIAILEYSGLAASSSLDVTAAAQGTSAGANSGSAMTTASGDLLLGALITKNGHSLTGSTGYTFREFVPAQPSTKLGVEDQVLTTSGATSAGATLSSSDTWIMGLAAFKAAH